MKTALALLALALLMAALPALAMPDETTRKHGAQKQFSIGARQAHPATAAMASPPRPASGVRSISTLPKGEPAPRSATAALPAAEPMRAWLAWAHFTVAAD